MARCRYDVEEAYAKAELGNELASLEEPDVWFEEFVKMIKGMGLFVGDRVEVAASGRGGQGSGAHARGMDRGDIGAFARGAIPGGSKQSFQTHTAAGSAQQSGNMLDNARKMAPISYMSGAGGAVDPFDLNSARRRNPPLPKTFSAGDGGTHTPRAGKGSQRFETRGSGIVRSTQYDLAPVAPLVASENAWKPTSVGGHTITLDEISAKIREARLILNKLTVEKFDTLYEQIKAIDVHNKEVLKGIVSEVFEKALMQPTFSKMYAELCKRLSDEVKDEFEGETQVVTLKDGSTEVQVKPVNFRSILLKSCQSEFQRSALSDSVENTRLQMIQAKAAAAAAQAKEGATDQETAPTISENDVLLAMMREKRRMLGNVRFIGELFVKDLIKEQIIRDHCIGPLMQKIEKKASNGASEADEEDIEALCKLLSTVGKKMDDKARTKKAKYSLEETNEIYTKLTHVAQDKSLPSRARFMIQDMLELRENKWVPRRQENEAKKISEIHKDIEKNDLAKSQAQAEINRIASMRGGRGGGSGGAGRGGDYRRGGPPGGYTSSVKGMTQHMSGANAVSGSTATSRVDSMMNRVDSDRVSEISAGMSDVRLGPSRPGAGALGGRSGAAWRMQDRGGKQTKGAGFSSAAAAGSGVGGATGFGLSGSGGHPAGAGGASGGGARGGADLLTTNSFSALENDDDAPVVSSGNNTKSSQIETTGAEPTLAAADGRGLRVEKAELPKDKLKRRTKSIVSDFIATEDVEDLKNRVEELHENNFADFLDNVLNESLDATPEQRTKIGRLLVLCNDAGAGELTPGHYISAFEPYLEELDSNEIDFLGITPVLGAYVGACYGARCFGIADELAVDWIAPCLEQVNNKGLVATFIVCALAALRDSGASVDECRPLYKQIGVDVLQLTAELKDKEKEKLNKLIQEKNAEPLLAK
ncbi:Eukaryotic translation initiation factor 4 gamma 1 [Porphyridium purpureum]|uniref:Eukaryotic translation initiation factor 4 gamma 1 n=1 Tax=Porphyridium purpureum TaxID=35688 RepID=A0A5J4Z5M4_PORPP|nr:Eukaryotic translation initiation factor 4 gamma 1 [Porphyridium purpureum]|eukprot:POR6781..scf295_1